MPIPPAGNQSEELAQRLFKALVGDLNAVLPEVNLFDDAHSIPWDANSDVLKPVEKLKIEDMVAYFQAIMEAFKDPLSSEYEKGRITGVEYSKTYIALTQAAMQAAVQFALGKDQAFWLAAKTQADAITANNQNELMRINAMLARASYALTKLKLATEDSQFGASNLNVTDVIPNQVLLTQAQQKLVSEQTEAQRAQTSDLRTDGAPIQGLTGKQKELYNQQIVSYQEDVKAKATRIFTDLWVTLKTVDEGSVPTPTLLTNADFNALLSDVRTSIKPSP